MSEPVHDQRLEELIHRADLDELIRMIDDRCATRDWDGLERLRNQCRAAVTTGRQLWPAAILAEYRLTLWAPAATAARMVDEAIGTVSLGAASIGTGVTGPLTEVVAQHHSWAELSAHLKDPIARAYVLHECALRGEEIPLGDRNAAASMIIEIPATPASWEPSYLLAVYSDHGAQFPTPPVITATTPFIRAETGEPIEDDQVIAVREAFDSVVQPWISHSNGYCEVLCVDGGPEQAIAVCAPEADQVRMTQIDSATALQWIHWIGASGGAHGRRPGAAAGRDALWWLLGTIGELTDQWPPAEADMTELLDDLTWWWWESPGVLSGWNLQLLCQDAPHGVTWAFTAHDAV
jgi:hypothetical protein